MSARQEEHKKATAILKDKKEDLAERVKAVQIAKTTKVAEKARKAAEKAKKAEKAKQVQLAKAAEKDKKAQKVKQVKLAKKTEKDKKDEEDEKMWQFCIAGSAAEAVAASKAISVAERNKADCLFTVGVRAWSQPSN